MNIFFTQKKIITWGIYYTVSFRVNSQLSGCFIWEKKCWNLLLQSLHSNILKVDVFRFYSHISSSGFFSDCSCPEADMIGRRDHTTDDKEELWRDYQPHFQSRLTTAQIRRYSFLCSSPFFLKTQSNLTKKTYKNCFSKHNPTFLALLLSFLHLLPQI